MSDPAPVPPLFLQSPSESKNEHSWWPGTHKTSNHIDGDFLQNDLDNLTGPVDSVDQNATDFTLTEEGIPWVKPDKSVSRRNDIPKLFLDDLLEDDTDKKRKRAAINIQRWFRGWKTRKDLSGKDAVKELLKQKKIEKENQIMSDCSLGMVCFKIPA